MNKKYLYLILTRSGVTTLPVHNLEEKEVYNMQYLGEIESNTESATIALEEFLQSNLWITKDYELDDFVIYKMINQREIYHL